MDEEELELPKAPFQAIVIKWDPDDNYIEVDTRGVPVLQAITILGKAAEAVSQMVEDPIILTDDPALCSYFEDDEDEIH